MSDLTTHQHHSHDIFFTVIVQSVHATNSRQQYSNQNILNNKNHNKCRRRHETIPAYFYS